MKINIDELTIKEVRELQALLAPTSSIAHPFEINANYFIRTVTHHHTGKLVRVTDTELVLENAAWIADDGRLTDALSKCEFGEVEIFPVGSQVVIGRGSLIDAVKISKIPTSQK